MSSRVFQAPRGTNDILPADQTYRHFFRTIANRIASQFGYDRIDTPTFEDAGLFLKGVGQDTDISEKETYTFEDRGSDLLTLRPEGTAPVCRAYLQHGMYNQPQPIRLYYIGDFFRYDRPQSGRYRQFSQFGIELIGELDASADLEIIQMAQSLLKSVGISDASILINSIGDLACRSTYIDELRSYYNSHESELIHEDCKRRLVTNPLRLLDCKKDTCQHLITGAPNSIEYLCTLCLEHWHALLDKLGMLGIQHQVDKRLVRGLDYYSRTVFEIVPSQGGQQNTLVAGGRYDGLMELLGGPSTPGVGFAMGIERVLSTIQDNGTEIPKDNQHKIVVAHIGEASISSGITLASELRENGISILTAPARRGLKSQLRYASSVKASHAIIIGDQEIEKGTVMLRDLINSEQREVPRMDLVKLFS